MGPPSFPTITQIANQRAACSSFCYHERVHQKYVIVHFIEKTRVPDEFSASEWPLHVTLLANFSVARTIEDLENELASYAQQVEPFDIVADREAAFGPSKNVAVSLIRLNRNIIRMHHKLHALTAKLGAVYDEPAFMGNGYRPHATIQYNARLSDGQKITLGDFTLVDMWPGKDITRRKVIRTFQLTGKPS